MGARKTILDAVVQVLGTDPKGATAKQIYDRIVEGRLYEFRAKDPIGVVRGAIRKHLRAERPASRLAQVARDRFRTV
jgi:hypothetical protein